jgi:hypothetical protein
MMESVLSWGTVNGDPYNPVGPIGYVGLASDTVQVCARMHAWHSAPLVHDTGGTMWSFPADTVNCAGTSWIGAAPQHTANPPFGNVAASSRPGGFPRVTTAVEFAVYDAVGAGTPTVTVSVVVT